MSGQQEVQAPFEAMARLGRALANPYRLRFLHVLAQGERTVEALAAAIALPPVTVSHHLQSLRRAGLLTAKRSGRHVVYGLASAEVQSFWLRYSEFAHHRLAELQVLTGNLALRRTLRGRVDLATLQMLLENNAAVPVDVRPAAEFAAGHLPGAVSIPREQVEQSLSQLPTSGIIVLYCRGPHCLLADDAQQVLAAHGIRTLRLEEGVPEWEAAGLPVHRKPGFQPVIPSATG